MKQYLFIAYMLLFHNSFVLGSEENTSIPVRIVYCPEMACKLPELDLWPVVEYLITTHIAQKYPGFKKFERSFALITKDSQRQPNHTEHVVLMPNGLQSSYQLPCLLAKYKFTNPENQKPETVIIRIDGKDSDLEYLASNPINNPFLDRK